MSLNQCSSIAVNDPKTDGTIVRANRATFSMSPSPHDTEVNIQDLSMTQRYLTKNLF